VQFIFEILFHATPFPAPAPKIHKITFVDREETGEEYRSIPFYGSTIRCREGR
jgi:hypothetical protein